MEGVSRLDGDRSPSLDNSWLDLGGRETLQPGLITRIKLKQVFLSDSTYSTLHAPSASQHTVSPVPLLGQHNGVFIRGESETYNT